MKLKTACLRYLSGCLLGLGGIPLAWAQTEASPAPSLTLSAPLALPAPVTGEPLPTPALAQPVGTAGRLEQVWDVVEVMGRPLDSTPRRARLVIRGPGTLMVDGGCNYFTGRIERGAEGAFRVSRYSGTHNECSTPSRSEAVLNSALVMVNNYRFDGGLVLSSGDSDLVRLVPSANQDSSVIEQAAERAKPTPRSASRAGKPGKKKGAKAHAVAGKGKAGKSDKGGKVKGKSAKSSKGSKATPPAKKKH